MAKIENILHKQPLFPYKTPTFVNFETKIAYFETPTPNSATVVTDIYEVIHPINTTSLSS